MNYLALFYAITIIILILLHSSAIIFNIKNNNFKKILINKYFIFILISFIGIAFINIFYLNQPDFYISSTSECLNLSNDFDSFYNKFFIKLCINPKILYIFFSIIFFIYLYLINKKIDFAKCFKIAGLIFALISILHFCLDIFLRENYEIFYNSIFRRYNSSNNYAYFQLLPFYISGFRNVEGFPIIAGYFFSLMDYLHKSDVKKKKSLYNNFTWDMCFFFIL